MLNNRENQLLREFSFFGEPEPRSPSHIYELRTYHLKVTKKAMEYKFYSIPTLLVQ